MNFKQWIKIVGSSQTSLEAYNLARCAYAAGRKSMREEATAVCQEWAANPVFAVGARQCLLYIGSIK